MTLILFLMLQATPAISFDQLVQTALAQNKGLQAAREQLRQAEARLKQSRAPAESITRLVEFDRCGVRERRRKWLRCHVVAAV